MNEDQARKLVTEEVGKAKAEIVEELGGKLDELKAALPATKTETEPADPDPEPTTEPESTADPEPEPTSEPAPEPSLDEKVADIEKRLKGVEAGASRAAPGQDDPSEEKNEKWSGVLDSAFLSLPRQ